MVDLQCCKLVSQFEWEDGTRIETVLSAQFAVFNVRYGRHVSNLFLCLHFSHDEPQVEAVTKFYVGDRNIMLFWLDGFQYSPSAIDYTVQNVKNFPNCANRDWDGFKKKGFLQFVNFGGCHCWCPPHVDSDFYSHRLWATASPQQWPLSNDSLARHL